MVTASIIVQGYNAMAHYEACLQSILEQDMDDFEVIWADSASTDGSREEIQTRFPQVKIVAFDSNIGYRRATNAGACQAQGKYLVICNQDTYMHKSWLSAMICCMEASPHVGIVAPKILLADQPDRINEAGNTLHYSGMHGSRGLGASAADYSVPETIATMSGCCFLIRRDLWIELGGFSPDFDVFSSGWHASHEDVDLAWRAQLLGHTILYCPSSVMYHKYKQRGVPPARFCSFDWGWRLTILRNYELRTLAFLLPAVAALDLATWLYSLARGPAWLAVKLRVTAWFLTHACELGQMRHRVQSGRRISDLPIVRRMSPTLARSGAGWVKRMADVLSCLYFRLFLGLLRLTEKDETGVSGLC